MADSRLQRKGHSCCYLFVYILYKIKTLINNDGNSSNYPSDRDFEPVSYDEETIRVQIDTSDAINSVSLPTISIENTWKNLNEEDEVQRIVEQ